MEDQVHTNINIMQLETLHTPTSDMSVSDKKHLVFFLLLIQTFLMRTPTTTYGERFMKQKKTRRIFFFLVWIFLMSESFMAPFFLLWVCCIVITYSKAKYRSTGKGCQSCSWSAEQEK